jgi:hypothetical protein
LEFPLSKKSSANPKQKKVADKKTDEEIRAAMNQPWLQMRSGLIIITLLSLAMVIFIAWQYWLSLVWWKAIGLGLLFGGAIWLIFIAGVWFNHFMRRGRKP